MSQLILSGFLVQLASVNLTDNHPSETTISRSLCCPSQAYLWLFKQLSMHLPGKEITNQIKPTAEFSPWRLLIANISTSLLSSICQQLVTPFYP